MDWCNVYVIRNRVNDKVYVGQTWTTLSERLSKHKTPKANGCRKLYNAFKKYGRDNFIIELLTVAHTQGVANYWEQHFIKSYESIERGYNIKDGGSNGKPSLETRRLMSEAQKGKTHTEASKKKMSLAKIGRPLSQETRIKQSAAKIGNTIMLGKHHSEKTRQKMSASSSGEKHPGAKLTWKIVRSIREEFASGARQVDLAKKYGVSQQIINQIVRRKTWIE
jgi:group I intron endonuclease